MKATAKLIKNAKGNQNCEWYLFDGIRYTRYVYKRDRQNKV
jgi:hypothetical protein